MKNLITLFAILVSGSAFCQGQLQNEVAGFLTFTSGKVMQLADAIPAEKYSWAPEEGVRSVSGVLTHLVSANYFFGMKMGAKVPEGVNMETIEKDLKTKEEITKALKESYDFIIGAVKNVKDSELATKVEYPFPGEFTNMSSVLIGLFHSNEHLGQLIGYARVNGITPPWSQGSED